jgi:hypothetical protein
MGVERIATARLRAAGMAIPVEFTKATDEMLVADILASWSIEDVRQLIEEYEAELRRRPAPPRGALRSRPG